MSKRILIVSYLFGNNSGVGGNRWMKYANHLASIGFEVIILSSEVNIDSNHINKKIELHLINSRYPKVLSRSRLSIIQKII